LYQFHTSPRIFDLLRKKVTPLSDQEENQSFVSFPKEELFAATLFFKKNDEENQFEVALAFALAKNRYKQWLSEQKRK